MARLVMQMQDGRTVGVELNPGLNRLGRSTDNDIAVDCPSVSSHHCELILEDGAIRVRDLGSTNGTFINDRPAGQEAWLKAGETLRLGDVAMVLEAAGITVAIPQFEESKGPRSLELEDGGWTCLNHAEARALWRCTHCGRWFCNTCVHHLRRLGGSFLNLCPVCSFPCELVRPETEAREGLALVRWIKKVFKVPGRRRRRRRG